MKMGVFVKEDMKSRRSIWRGIKTVFFLIAMFVSFLVFSAPILLVLADMFLPSALLSSLFSFNSLNSLLENYDFRSSLIDIPIISILRSAIIFCVYGFCDGPKLSSGVYLGTTVVCSAVSLFFVSLKASFVFSDDSKALDRIRGFRSTALFACSSVLAIGHVLVAYRTSCRERRKLLVYKIDVEAVSGLQRYPKIQKEESE